MATRTPLVGGNWKMNLGTGGAVALARDLAGRLAPKGPGADVAIFPPFLSLDAVAKALQDSHTTITLGAQDFFWAPDGAFTGEVSLSMLQDVGATAVLVGHSERRHVIHEDDVLINRKVRSALDAGFEVLLCVGETIEQREAGQTDDINAAQLRYALAGLRGDHVPSKLAIAYEPVWAIGTGRTATADDAQKAHAAIREVLARRLGPRGADSVRILYGGSVKGSNAAELFAQPDIDGGLIGGASLKAEEFCAIVEAAGAGR